MPYWASSFFPSPVAPIHACAKILTACSSPIGQPEPAPLPKNATKPAKNWQMASIKLAKSWMTAQLMRDVAALKTQRRSDLTNWHLHPKMHWTRHLTSWKRQRKAPKSKQKNAGIGSLLKPDFIELTLWPNSFHLQIGFSF